MYAQLHFDPEQGKFVEVYPVMPGTCQFCQCEINQFAVMNFKNCCEECWNMANQADYDNWMHDQRFND